MSKGVLGKVYRDGEIIVREGEIGECMYVIQEGQVEVLVEKPGGPVSMAVLGEGEFFGEMALFDHEVRSAMVRALGEVRALTVDRRNLLRQIREDPSLAFRIIDVLSRRVRTLDGKVSHLLEDEEAPRK